MIAYRMMPAPRYPSRAAQLAQALPGTPGRNWRWPDPTRPRRRPYDQHRMPQVPRGWRATD